MKIALCDDDKKERDRLVSFFIEYSLQTGIASRYSTLKTASIYLTQSRKTTILMLSFSIF
jgi:hypothetical protein